MIIALALLIRLLVSTGPYSGFSKPTLFGDFEAQRHWMEITTHLPAKDWYVHSVDNDLMYWGLDYPPLTAYHSCVMGQISHQINESWVQLHTSRGVEAPSHKLFMRMTVLVCDVLMFMSACAYLCSQMNCSSIDRQLYLAAFLLYPGLVLIDHAHFQYNCVSLGLLVWAVTAMDQQSYITASVLFSLALNYKQMALYHSLPFFFVLLGTCLQKGVKRGSILLVQIGLATVLTFAICWAPFLQDFALAKQVLQRVFPVGRGLFEDKVANFWCCLNVLVKLKVLLAADYLVLLCSIFTLLSSLFSCVLLFARPTSVQFRYSLFNCSLAFFLFSYQVHEKSILLVAVPALLLLRTEPLPVCWFLLTSTASLHPLILKDETQYSFWPLFIAFYVYVVSVFDFHFSESEQSSVLYSMFKKLFHVSVWVSAFVCLLPRILPAPSALPDIFTVVLCGYACGHFLAFLWYFNFRQYEHYKQTSALAKRLKRE